jgi:hypothetical protein
MTMRYTLLSGVAGLAVAGLLTFGTYAQTDAPMAAPQAANPGQTPATAPSAGPVAQPKHLHHRLYKGQSGPQDSTPAEHAATDRLNQQALQQAQTAPQVTATTMPAAPAAPADAAAPVTPPSTPQQ